MALFQAKAELWLAGEEIKEEIQYTKIVLMLGDEGLSRWSKFDMGLGKDISFQTARATLYSGFQQQKGETAAELDLRLSKLVDECKFPTDSKNIKEFLKRDIFINVLGSIYKLAPFINRAAPFSSLKKEQPFINTVAPFSSSFAKLTTISFT